MKTRYGIIVLLGLAFAGPATFGAGAKHAFDLPADADSMRVAIKFNVPTDFEMTIAMAETNDVLHVKARRQSLKDEYVEKVEENGEKKSRKVVEKFPDAGLSLAVSSEHKTRKIGILPREYWFMPYVFGEGGFYTHKHTVANKERWARDFKPFAERTAVFDFRYDAEKGDTAVYLDRNFAGRIRHRGKIRRIGLSIDEASTVTSETYVANPEHFAIALPSIEGRSADFLREGAELKLDVKLPSVSGIPFDVWGPEKSLDQGRHCRVANPRSFGYDPYYARTPWKGGPEYMQWTVPEGFYTYVYALCADIPGTNTVPVLGSSFGLLGPGANGENFAQAFTDLSPEAAATNRFVRKVGTLSYARDGRRQTTPVYLVKQRLDVGKCPQIMNFKHIFSLNEKTGYRREYDREMWWMAGYATFEFLGAKNQDKIRSSVQVLGAMLVKSDFSFDVCETERGNIFHNDEKPETGMEVTALKDDVAGTIDWRIRDDDFNELDRGTKSFAIARKGETKRVMFDLSRPEVGWYMIDYTFRDRKGEIVMEHHGAFTLLGKNDREAGFESPYACWPQGAGYGYTKEKGWGFWALGRNNSNPIRSEVAELMYKAGYHSGWGVPCKDENEFPEYQITQSAFSQFCNGIYWPPKCRYNEQDAITISNRIEEAVRYYKEEMTRWPHCKTIQVLHEQGGKTISRELIGKRKPVRGEYKALKGHHLVYWCTEIGRRMKKEFPDFHIQIGNGSSSCEMIGHLVNHGLDLSYFDTLGIESKGFGTMPEFAKELEAPGMLWALKETANVYGYSNMLVNACNEYVFRPERPADVAEGRPRDQRMMMTNYALRDTLISLAHGCWTISIGHLEDCDSLYYNTAWGSGGQCTFYPMSYPKRMFTGLANLTKVMDKATFTRTLFTGAHSVYTVEFRRDRKVKDYAYAVWAAIYHGEIGITFPKGAEVKYVDWQGRSRILKADANGRFVLPVGPTPFYLVSKTPMTESKYLRNFMEKIDGTVTTLAPTTKETLYVMTNDRSGWTIDGRAFANFDLSTVADPAVGGEVANLKHDLAWSKPASPLVEEECGLRYRSKLMTKANPDDFDEIGIWVRGNGSTGKVVLEIWGSDHPHRLEFPGRSVVAFDGWRLLRTKMPKVGPDKEGKRWFYPYGLSITNCRGALDPRDMRPVTEDLRFGNVVGIRLNRRPAASGPKEETWDAMKFVDEKDL